MRLETVTAEIRPRSEWEAIDLGFVLVRRDFWRCLCVWWLSMLPITAVVVFFLWDSPIWVALLFWWLKPIGSRMVLFELSRRLFGEAPSWGAVAREIPRAWTRRFFYRMIWGRLSPWLPVTMAVEDLEGLRGEEYKKRCTQLSRRSGSAVMWLYFTSEMAVVWLSPVMLKLVLSCIPQGQDGVWQTAVESWDPSNPFDIPVLILRAVVATMVVAMSLMDVFSTGAGFGIYLNNRTWMEGWDVELALKRMAKRLAKMFLPCLLLMCVLSPCAADAGTPESEPARIIREVKSRPEFKVHTIKEKVPVPGKVPSWLERLLKSISPGSAAPILKDLLIVAAVGLLVAAIIWLVWKNRHALMGLQSGLPVSGEAAPPVARVVMGMDVSPETLPQDIPGAAMALWRAGACRDALGLLYRGAVSMEIVIGRVQIRESDTEGDCMRRVEQMGESAHPSYFKGLTRIWLGLAYAGMHPRDEDVEALCLQWPFTKGGRS